MSLLTLIGMLLIMGILLWVIQAVPWIDPGVKQIIRIIVIAVVAIWLIAVFFGVGPEVLNRRIGGNILMSLPNA